MLQKVFLFFWTYFINLTVKLLGKEYFMSEQAVWWVGFHILVFVMLAIDLGLSGRKGKEVGVKEAMVWSAIWISVALAFNAFVYYLRGAEAATNFLAGYLVEKSLSVDNLFVFVLIFSYFKVPPVYQRKVLLWGILGALIMRAVFIVAGVQLISYFSWMMYIFGGFLIFTGIKLITEKDKDIEPENNPLLKLFRKIMPIKTDYGVGKFLVKENGIWHATQLFVVLIVVETTDVIFAIDSVPAILGIVKPPDTFIVYTSNVMAILGLRALYFALAGIMGMFHYLAYGLSAILCFIGVKMIIGQLGYHMPTAIALGVVALILVISVVASVLFKPVEEKAAESGD